MGSDTVASGSTSTAMGLGTVASGDWSTAMGQDTKAEGHRSTAMGFQTVAEGEYSTAMGFQTRVGLLKAINDEVGGILAAAELLQTHYNDHPDATDDDAVKEAWETKFDSLKVVYNAAASEFTNSTYGGASTMHKRQTKIF